jgi:hypothetical protein
MTAKNGEPLRLKLNQELLDGVVPLHGIEDMRLVISEPRTSGFLFELLKLLKTGNKVQLKISLLQIGADGPLGIAAYFATVLMIVIVAAFATARAAGGPPPPLLKLFFGTAPVFLDVQVIYHVPVDEALPPLAERCQVLRNEVGTRRVPTAERSSRP